MAGLTAAEKATIRKDLKDAGYSDEEAESTLADVDAAQGGSVETPDIAAARPPGPMMTKALYPMLGAFGGASVGRALLGKVLTRPLAAALGTWAGTTGGSMVPERAGGPGLPPSEAIKTGLLPALTEGAVEGGLNMTARGSAALAGVHEEAVEPVMARGPIGGARLSRFPKMIRGGPPKGAEDALAGRFRADMDKPLPGMAEAEQAVASRPGVISGGPVRQAILRRIRRPIPGATELPTTGEAAANEALEAHVKGVPKTFGRLQDMEDYLQRIRQPIEQSFGKPVPQLATQDLKGIQSDVRSYRDALLGGPDSPGAQGYAKASARLQAIGPVKKLLEEPGGEQSLGAEGAIKRAWGNQELMRRLKAVNPDLAKEVEDLAIERQWTKPAHGIHRIRLLARPVARTAAFMTRPAGQVAGAATAYQQALATQQPENNP